MTRLELGQAIALTAEVMGQAIDETTIVVMVRELYGYEPHALAEALRRCRRELSGRLTLATILERLDGGHPAAEEAWSLCPRDEGQTVVWTQEISEAFSAACPLLEAGDQVAARMAFKETYQRLMREARDSRTLARWTVSLGHDVAGRATPLLVAAEKGRLSRKYVDRLTSGLPDSEHVERVLGPQQATAGALVSELVDAERGGPNDVA